MCSDARYRAAVGVAVFFKTPAATNQTAHTPSLGRWVVASLVYIHTQQHHNSMHGCSSGGLGMSMTMGPAGMGPAGSMLHFSASSRRCAAAAAAPRAVRVSNPSSAILARHHAAGQKQQQRRGIVGVVGAAAAALPDHHDSAESSTSASSSSGPVAGSINEDDAMDLESFLRRLRERRSAQGDGEEGLNTARTCLVFSSRVPPIARGSTSCLLPQRSAWIW